MITTSIEEDSGCRAHEIEEVTMKNDIKELAMDDTAKAVNQRHMESSMLVPEFWQLQPKPNVRPKRRKAASKER